MSQALKTLYLRTFGCICFDHLPPHERQILSAQSVRCAFFEYNVSKGICLLLSYFTANRKQLGRKESRTKRRNGRETSHRDWSKICTVKDSLETLPEGCFDSHLVTGLPKNLKGAPTITQRDQKTQLKRALTKNRHTETATDRPKTSYGAVQTWLNCTGDPSETEKKKKF